MIFSPFFLILILDMHIKLFFLANAYQAYPRGDITLHSSIFYYVDNILFRWRVHQN